MQQAPIEARDMCVVAVGRDRQGNACGHRSPRLESKVDRAELAVAGGRERRYDDQYERECALADHQNASSDPLMTTRAACPGLVVQYGLDVESSRDSCRRPAYETRRDDHRSRGKHPCVSIEGNIIASGDREERARRSDGKDALNDVPSESGTDHRGAGGEDRGFCEELARDPSRCRANRRLDREFLPSSCEPGERYRPGT
jgi:hypothetical protein